MKTKTKGKAITGIAMAAIMLALVFATIVPTGTAQVPDYPPGGRTVGPGGLIIIGERNVSFSNPVVGGIIQNGAIKGPTEDIGSVGKNSTYICFTNYVDTTGQGLVTAEYYVINRTTGTVNYTVTFINPCFILKTLMPGTTDEVTSCTKGGTINISLKTNLEFISTTGTTVHFKITDPKGVSRDKNNQSLDSSGNKEVMFTATDEVGEYTVYIKTNKTRCNGLDVLSSEITFTVIEPGITIDADKTKIVKGTEVVLTGATLPKEQIWVNVTSGVKGNVNFTAKGSYTGPEFAASDAIPGVCVTTALDGTYTVVAKIADVGVYEFEARLGATTTTDKVTVEVTDPIATITIDKTTYVIGEDIKISGTSAAGDYAIIAFDGRAIANEAIKADDTFSYTLSGSSIRGAKPAGSYKIELFIYPTTTTTDVICGITTGTPTSQIFKPGTTIPATPDDATVILLTDPRLTVSLSTGSIALGDYFTVSGAATGVNEVTILVIAPKGAAGIGITADRTADTGISLKTTSVSTVDYMFSLKREVDKTGIDTGKYLVVAVSPGRDGKYGRTENTTLIGAIEYDLGYNLTNKTQSQILAILEDVCSPTLSDDLMWTDYINVGMAFVTLNPIASVSAGEPLVVTGSSNRKEGVAIVITVKGPVELTPRTVLVENGKFNATFDTTGAPAGTYTVKADDGDGHTDTATVEILPAITPTSMRLHEHWNFISVPKKLADGNNTFAQVFDAVNTSGHSIFYYNITEGWRAVTATEEVKPLRGYWIYSAEDIVLNLTYDTYPLRTPPTRPLYKGWNAIGFSDTTAATANSALTSIEKSWAYLLGFDAATQKYESAIINNDETGGRHDEDNSMYPMKGYWVYVTEDCELAGISV